MRDFDESIEGVAAVVVKCLVIRELSVSERRRRKRSMVLEKLDGLFVCEFHQTAGEQSLNANMCACAHCRNFKF